MENEGKQYDRCYAILCRVQGLESPEQMTKRAKMEKDNEEKQEEEMANDND
ncbi:MAG: hypothetical protein WC616_01525 [Candidatus Omnitrophota bacterium]